MGEFREEYKFYKYGQWVYKKLYNIYQPIYFSWKRKKDSNKINFLKDYVKPGMTVVDVGANIGFYTTIFLKLVGQKGKVYAFEPDALNFKHLVRNTRKYTNAINNNCAASDKSGKIKLYRYGLNVEFKTYDIGESIDFVEINGVTLDDYFKNGECVDVVKTDTEGFEYSVIKGMKELVKRSKNIVLITEFWPYMLDRAGVDPGEFINGIKEMGFTTLKFVDEQAEFTYKKMVSERYNLTDIIAIKSSE